MAQCETRCGRIARLLALGLRLRLLLREFLGMADVAVGLLSHPTILLHALRGLADLLQHLPFAELQQLQHARIHERREAQRHALVDLRERHLRAHGHADVEDLNRLVVLVAGIGERGVAGDVMHPAGHRADLPDPTATLAGVEERASVAALGERFAALAGRLAGHADLLGVATLVARGDVLELQLGELTETLGDLREVLPGADLAIDGQRLGPGDAERGGVAGTLALRCAGRSGALQAELTADRFDVAIVGAEHVLDAGVEALGQALGLGHIGDAGQPRQLVDDALHGVGVFLRPLADAPRDPSDAIARELDPRAEQRSNEIEHGGQACSRPRAGLAPRTSRE
jgi:hypothetical protein